MKVLVELLNSNTVEQSYIINWDVREEFLRYAQHVHAWLTNNSEHSVLISYQLEGMKKVYRHIM